MPIALHTLSQMRMMFVRASFVRRFCGWFFRGRRFALIFAALLSAVSTGVSAESSGDQLVKNAGDKLTKNAGDQRKPRYKLELGKGTSVCEAYLKHLNAFPPEEPLMLCERKLHPSFSNFKKPDWEEIDLWEHLDWVYEIDYSLEFPHHENEDFFHYVAEGKKALSFEAWKKDYEVRIKQTNAKPRLYRATLPLEVFSDPSLADRSLPRNPYVPKGPPSRYPVEAKPRVWLAYDPGTSPCPGEYSIVIGGLYHHFVMNEDGKTLDYLRFLHTRIGSSRRADLLIYRGKPYFTHVLPGPIFNKKKKWVPTRQGSIIISRHTPQPWGPKDYSEDTCEFTFSLDVSYPEHP